MKSPLLSRKFLSYLLVVVLGFISLWLGAMTDIVLAGIVTSLGVAYFTSNVMAKGKEDYDDVD